MGKILKNMAGFSLGPIFSGLIAIVQIPLLTRLLTPESYGLFTFFKLLLLQIPRILCIGMDQAFAREFHSAQDRRRTFQQAILPALLVGVLFFLLSIVFAKPISRWAFHTEKDALLIIFGSLWALINIIESFVLFLVRMQERGFDFSKITAGAKLFTFLLTVFLLVTYRKDYVGAAMGMIFGNILYDLFLLYQYREFFDFRGFQWDRVLFKRMWLYAYPYILDFALSSLLNSLGNLTLHGIQAPGSLAIYNAALSIASVFSLITAAFTGFWFPISIRWHEEHKSQKQFSFVADVLLLVMSAAFVLALLGSMLLPFVLGKNYSAVSTIFGLVSLQPIFLVLSETTVLGITFARKTKYNLAIRLCIFFPTLLANMTLTPLWGYRGAALALAISQVVFYIARTYFSKRSGFWIPQKKQAVVMTGLFLMANYWAFAGAFKVLVLGVAFLFMLYFQRGTIRDIHAVYKKKEVLDF